MATPLGNSVPLTGNNLLDALTQGSKWSSGNLTYSLWDLPGVDSWTPNGKALFAAALDILEAYANLNFSYVETGGGASFTTDLEAVLTGNLIGYAYGALALGIFPDPAFGNAVLTSEGLTRNDWPNIEGAIFYDSYQSPFVYYANPGGVGFSTIIHEIGHALGLKHPHDDGGTGHPTFAQIGASGLDNQLNTIMSYNSVPGSTAFSGNPITPGILDIQVLQHLYGANMSYHAGDDVYQLLDDGLVETLWDAGGYDVVDGSALNVPLSLNLNPGTISIIGSTYGALAFNVTIESARGSSLSDSITGNEVENTLFGQGGNDTLSGQGGNDMIYGGAGIVDVTDGNDLILGDLGSDALYGNAGNDTICGGRGIADGADASDLIYGGKGSDEIYGNAGNDSLFGGGSSVDPLDTNDIVYGGYGADYILGNGGNDLLYGGGSLADPTDLGDTINGGVGNDELYGNGGNDELNGAENNDSLHGGVGDDRYIFGDNGGNDVILHFEGAGQAGGDVISIQSNINGTGITSVDQILGRISYAGSEALIDLGNGNSISVQDIITPLIATDFEIW